MGQAYLVRRGGVNDEELKILQYANAEELPTTAQEGSIAIITSAAIDEVYVQAETPANVAVGTLFFLAAGSDTTLLTIDSISFYSTGAFIRTDTEWLAVDTYIFRDGAWKFVPSGQLINAGNTYGEYTGGFVSKAKQGSDSSSASAKAPKVTYNDLGYPIVDTTSSSGSNGGGVYYTANMIDLTPYKTIVFEGTFTRGGTVARNFTVGAWSKIGTYYEDNLLAYKMMSSTSGTKISVDVKNVNVSAYIGIGMTYSKAIISRAYLVPKGV